MPKRKMKIKPGKSKNKKKKHQNDSRPLLPEPMALQIGED